METSKSILISNLSSSNVYYVLKSSRTSIYSIQSMQLSTLTCIIPGLPYCSFGRPMSYPVRRARPTARRVVHECRLGLSLNKWTSSVLVSHEYPGVLLWGAVSSYDERPTSLASGNCRVVSSN